GQEQGQSDQYLVRRRGLRTERLTQQREHDDDAGETGHHQQCGRQQRQRGQEQQRLQAQRIGGAAVGRRRAGHGRQAGLGGGEQGQAEQTGGEQNAGGFQGKRGAHVERSLRRFMNRGKEPEPGTEAGA